MKNIYRFLPVLLVVGCGGADDEGEDPPVIVVDPPETNICTAVFVYGVEVSLFDTISGEPVNICETDFALTEGEYVEEYNWLNGDGCDSLSAIVAAGERQGTYELVINKMGYEEWRSEGIIVSGDICHVETVNLDAFLVPED